MREKICKNKKGALHIAISILMAFSLFLVPLEVHARTMTYEHYYNRGFNVPWTYCGTDASVSATYEESFLCNLNTDSEDYTAAFVSEKYYMILSSGKLTTSSHEYDGSSLGVDYEPYGYFLYGGQKYYFAEDGYCTFIVSGTDYYTLPVYYGCNVTVSPYHADGYYYANGFRCYVGQNMRLRVYELSVNENITQSQLNEINELLVELNEYMASSVVLQETFNDALERLLLINKKIELNFDSFLEQLAYLMSEIDEQGISLDNIEHWTQREYGVLLDISEQFAYLANNLLTSNESDKNVMNDFKQDSDSQSSNLNNLNQQAQVDRIDVDSASGSVDDNLDIDVDSNYGVLLSTFTNNKNVLTMLLAVASMGLISYVLFGKR